MRSLDPADAQMGMKCATIVVRAECRHPLGDTTLQLHQRSEITREPGPMKHGGSEIAFVEDPDGYKIELIELKGRQD